MADGIFRQRTLPYGFPHPDRPATRTTQRCIAVVGRENRYCLRPPAFPEVMPWARPDDDAPELTFTDD